MILFNDVVEILDLADLDSRVLVGVVAYDRRLVGAAFVDRDLNAFSRAGTYLRTQR